MLSSANSSNPSDRTSEQSASRNEQQNVSTDCSEQNQFDLNLVKTEPEENSLGSLSQVEGGEPSEQALEINIKQEQCVENLPDEEIPAEEIVNYNLHEEIEFISVDSFKVEPCLEECDTWNDSPNCKTDIVKDIKEGNLGKDINQESDVEEHKEGHPESETNFKVQAPLKTYQRKTPVCKRPTTWDADVAKKIKKICNKFGNNDFEQFANEEGSIDLPFPELKKSRENRQVELNVKEQSKENPQVELNVKEQCKANPRVEMNLKEKKKKKRDSIEKQYHVCVFCKKLCNNISKHFVKKHSDQIEVSLFKNLPIKSSVRVWQFVRLKRLGDFQHNINILQSKLNNLIVLQSSMGLLSVSNHDQFLPCPDCTGFVHQSQLYSHYCKCVSKLRRHVPATREVILGESCKLLSHAIITNAYMGSDWKLNFYKTSDFVTVAKEDACILLLRLHAIKNSDSLGLKSTPNVKELVERMARLLLCCRHLSNNYKLLISDVLVPDQIKLLMLSVKTIMSSASTCVEKLDLRDYFFSEISTCVFIWRGKCLLDGELSKADQLLKFYYKFLETWHDEIDTPKKTIKEFSDMPLMLNVTILKESLKSTIINLIQRIKSMKKPGDLCCNLARSTFCMLCLFNPVCFNVVENLKVSEYAVRPDWRVDNMKDYGRKMSTLAFYLAEKRFVVRTNLCDKEYVLLFTKEVKRAIDVLISNHDSSFVFSGMNNFIKFDKSVNPFIEMCIRPGFLNDDVMINMKKRQYISFIAQISDMSKEEEHWIKEWYQANKKILGCIALDSPFLGVNKLSEVFDMCKKACIEMKQAIEAKPIGFGTNKLMK